MTDIPRTVLVVDDETDVRNFLKAALLEAGFKVVVAKDGFEALEQVQAGEPDLISLDLVMPGKSGAKFYRDLTKNKQWAKIPILIVTGHAHDELGNADLKELTMSGPGVYLEKPVSPQNYIAAVKRILGMDTSSDTEKSADQSALKDDLKGLIDKADSRTLEELKKLLANKKPGGAS
ncbi:MAG: response regulator [candidate division Zixibacteria bacterium]|jgi:DNA-binding response OmpR family regulator|nr:response regulator [candidate division Zixibacteria bacterium]